MSRAKKHFSNAKKHAIPTFIIATGIGFIFLGIFILWVALLPTPDLSSFEDRKVIESTKIYDRTGEVLLYDVNKDIKRSSIPLEDISPYIRNATVALEDDTFYEHMGIRPVSVLRAALANLLRGEFSQGGSTITQQVVKNSILTTEKLISRKIKEWFLAIKLEQKYTKDEILETYLNESPYGGTLYGVEEASQNFFGVSASDVTLAEAAYLAALPKAPTFFSPYGNNQEALENRKNFALKRMLELGFISEEEYKEALREQVVFEGRRDSSILAPHFVFYVQEELEKKYGPRFLETGGVKVITTLDYELQDKAEAIVNQYALENAERFDAENAALVSIDPRNGEVLTMVGSRDYFDEEIDGNFNIAVAERQPGSTFKPFVYAQALREGYTRDTVVFDVPTQFSTACSPTDLSNEAPCYAPNNYDSKFRGPMRFIDALAQSVNVPAVKALYLVGIQDAISLASRMGLTTLVDPARYGLSLVLGGGEVRLLDMVSAYGVFAAEGIRNEPVVIKEIIAKDDSTLYEQESNPRQVLEAEVARELTYMLSNNEARIPAFGANSPLYFPGYDVAAKTGTTNDYRDAWIIGYTPNIVVGAWAGNNDNRSMDKQVAGFIIAPLWSDFMREALVARDQEFFGEVPSIPQDIQPILRGIWINTEDGEEFTGIHSILHYINKSNPRGPAPLNPAQDPQYLLWETAVQRWVGSN